MANKTFFILGLGNQGNSYSKHWHNLGKMYAQYLQANISSYNAILAEKHITLKPFTLDCYMNESGQFLAQYAKSKGIKPENLILAFDDLDINFPLAKISPKTPKVHNGVTSVKQYFGTPVWNVRLGANSSDKAQKNEAKSYLLSPIPENLSNELTALFKAASDSLLTVL